MLKSLPVAKPNELYRIGDKIRCCNWGGYNQGEDGDFSLSSWEMYKHFRANTPEFVDLAALQAGNAALGVRRVGSQAQADTRNGEVSALLATLIPARRAAGGGAYGGIAERVIRRLSGSGIYPLKSWWSVSPSSLGGAGG